MSCATMWMVTASPRSLRHRNRVSGLTGCDTTITACGPLGQPVILGCSRTAAAAQPVRVTATDTVVPPAVLAVTV